jgi:hypothetical protein
MTRQEQMEAEALSSQLDELLTGAEAPTQIAADLRDFTRILAAAGRGPTLDGDTRIRLWSQVVALSTAGAAERPGPPRDPRRTLGPMRLRVRWRWGFRSVAAAFAATVLLGGAVFAAGSPLVQQLWQRSDPGSAYVDQSGFVRELNLAETHAGVTIRLEWAYADGNRILVGYALEGLGGLTASGGVTTVDGAVLLDSGGSQYPLSRGLNGATSPISTNGLGAQVLSFDATSLPADARQVRLTLRLSEVRGQEVVGPQSSKPTVLAQGPWQFQFTLPVLPARITNPGQQATAAGIPMRLERVSVTPSETRVYLRFNPQERDGTRAWSPVALLEVAGRDAGPATSVQELVTGEGLWELRFPTPADAPGGTWSLTVSELVGLQAAGQTRITGPWVFRFSAPQ